MARAEALFDRFPGARSEQETLVPVVGGGSIAWAMLNPVGGLYYGPGFLDEMMRDVYAETGDEMRLAPDRVKEFCPEFYPGEATVDQMIKDIKAGG